MQLLVKSNLHFGNPLSLVRMCIFIGHWSQFANLFLHLCIRVHERMTCYFPCVVIDGYFSTSGSVTSPKTGRMIDLYVNTMNSVLGAT